jgi:hypothetical protein
VEFETIHLGFRESLRQLLNKGVLRSAGCSARFITKFNNGSRLVTSADRSVSPLTELAQQHMRRLDYCLRLHHPVKPVIYAGIEDLSDGLDTARQLITPAQLQALGVAPHLARLIAGPCRNPAEVLLP